MGKLRACGNSIVPQVAAEFIGAYLDLDEGPHDPAQNLRRDSRRG